MELFQELFVTAFVALVFSFVVAKLVSIAMCGDDERDLGLNSARGEAVVEELKFDGGLRVRSSKSKRKVEFVEEAVEKVDEFERERSVDKSEESYCSEGFEEKRCDSAVVCDSAGRIEVGEVVGPSEKSSEGPLRKKAVAEIVCGTEVGGIKEEDAVTNLEGLDVEEGSERRTEVDEFDGVEKGNVMTGLVIEEKIVENLEADSKIVARSASDDIVVAQGADVRDVESGENQGTGTERGLNEGDEEKEDLVGDEEDDWEGIERSALEEVFAVAANYVASGGKDDRLSNVGSDVQMQLYGLHKVAMEGPCHEPQPMALKVSARAKWNAWQRLGNMNPEVAMDQYITLLSDKVPGWMEGKSCGDDNAASLESGIPAAPYPNLSTTPHDQLDSPKKRELELMEGDLTGGSNSVNKE